MIETIIIAIESVLIVLALYGMIMLKKAQIDLVLKLTQSKVDIGILNDKIIQMHEDKKLLESEEFMAFIASSREYAFEYIEAVQEAITEYNAVIEPIINYHRTYGMAFGMDSVPYANLEKIAKAHDALMEIMPTDPNTIK
jgi:hypothetical protein